MRVHTPPQSLCVCPHPQPDPLTYNQCGYQCTFGQGTCVLSSVVGYNQYYTCQCLPGYYGSTCALFTCGNNCSWNGECVDHDVCSCYRGFKVCVRVLCVCSRVPVCLEFVPVLAGVSAHVRVCVCVGAFVCGLNVRGSGMRATMTILFSCLCIC